MSTMNLKSNVIKLSILFMLILVLIPVASAMDSNETFYIEYDNADCGDVVGEYEVEDTSVEHSPNENVEASDSFSDDQYNNHVEDISINNMESSYEEISQINNVEYNQEVITPILNEDDVSVSKDYIIVIESELVNINVSDDFDNLTNDMDKTSENEFTHKENSVYGDLLFISKYGSNLNFLLIDAFYNKVCYSESSLNENDDITTKIFELKEKLLLKHDMQAHFDNQIVDEVEEIVCINKITTDFAYYIDNSIVGADSMFCFQSCFSNFKSYFYTIFLIFGDIF